MPRTPSWALAPSLPDSYFRSGEDNAEAAKRFLFLRQLRLATASYVDPRVARLGSFLREMTRRGEYPGAMAALRAEMGTWDTDKGPAPTTWRVTYALLWAAVDELGAESPRQKDVLAALDGASAADMERALDHGHLKAALAEHADRLDAEYLKPRPEVLAAALVRSRDALAEWRRSAFMKADEVYELCAPHWPGAEFAPLCPPRPAAEARPKRGDGRGTERKCEPTAEKKRGDGRGTEKKRRPADARAVAAAERRKFARLLEDARAAFKEADAELAAIDGEQRDRSRRAEGPKSGGGREKRGRTGRRRGGRNRRGSGSGGGAADKSVGGGGGRRRMSEVVLVRK